MTRKKNNHISSEDSSDSQQLTPLMSQYQSIKSAYPDYIVFFRLGDFYEMFGEDAITASPILGVVLTKRQNVPMCGVPHHSSDNYIKTLLNAGKKVAIAEQTGEITGSKKLITREVVRLITPGTVWEDNLLETKENNYVISIIFSQASDSPNNNQNMMQFVGIAAADISSSDCYLLETSLEDAISEITKSNTKEIIIPESQKLFVENLFSTRCASLAGDIAISPLPDWHFDEERAISIMSEISGIRKWDAIDPSDLTRDKNSSSSHKLARKAMGGLLSYLEHIKFAGIANVISRAYLKKTEEYLYISPQAMRSLEIISPIKGTSSAATSGKNTDTLVGFMDQTRTPMGSRLLASFITSPLTDTILINKRLESVLYFVENHHTRRQLRETLKNIGDIERILTRICAKSATPREIYHLGNSLKKALSLKTIFYLDNFSTQQTLPQTSSIPHLIEENIRWAVQSDKNINENIISLIEQAINPEGGSESGYIKTGFNKELDELRDFSSGAKNKLLEIEQREKERTGIPSLKIGYTSVFGYYIEVRKSGLSSVPPDYTRKQTLSNAERFVIPELVELENKILHAAENITRLEKEILSDIREKIRSYSSEILRIAKSIAILDTLSTFAEIAVAHNWTKPHILSHTDDLNCPIEIESLRHPIVEKNLQAGKFVPNDVHLSNKENQILLITGPNMGGKSTYLRQTALSIILAQAGSFVPAKKAILSVVDKIFSRVGSADNIATGESTFMTEMTETAAIMRQMTPYSLIILDEVGRGTSTFDGISIAWAIIEYLHNYGDKPQGGPKVLFATHYFELTELSEKLSRLKNFHVSATEWKGEVIFLYKIEPGAADRSYGIHVAKLAGMPAPILERSRQILHELETNSHQLLKIRTRNTDETSQKKNKTHEEQMDFEDFMIFDKLKNIDVNNITPLEALNILSDIKAAYKQKKA